MSSGIASSVGGVLGSLGSAASFAVNYPLGVAKEAYNAFGSAAGNWKSPSDPFDTGNKGERFTPTNRAQRMGADAMRGALQFLHLEPRPAAHVDATEGHALLARATARGGTAPVVARIEMTAPNADWGSADHTSGAVGIWVDGQRVAVEHVVAERTTPVEVDLGVLLAGEHDIEVRQVDELAASHAPDVRVDSLTTHTVHGDQALAARWAPTFEARDLGRPGGRDSSRTDLPLQLIASVRHEHDGINITYAMLASDEDAGTPPATRLATWGRIADNERALEVRLDTAGNYLGSTFEGPSHGYHPFTGATDPSGRPQLRVVTGNNNFSDRPIGSGDTWSPEPVLATPGGDQLDEELRQPWSFALELKELAREHAARADQDISTPDLRDRAFLHRDDPVRAALEAGATITLQLRNGTTAPLTAKSGAMVHDRIGAIELPKGVTGSDVVGVRGAAGGSIVVLDNAGLPHPLTAQP